MDYLTKAAVKAIRKFPFDDFGLDDTDPKSEYAEWVEPLARSVVEAVMKANRMDRGGGDIQIVLGGQS